MSWSRHFGNPQAEILALRDGNVISDLSLLSLVRVRGPEAKTFLNAQLTNDIETLDAGHSRLAAWCNAQGRMLAVFRVFMRDGDCYLQFPVLLRDEVIKRLRMFVLRSKVTIENADTQLVRFGVAGSASVSLLREAVGVVPDADDACASNGSVTLLRLPGIHPRFEIVAPPGDATSLWQTLQRHAMPAGSGAWAWHDIMAGIPTVLPQTKDAFVPQMANLELVSGVNFKKGCYPGQEIVARIQYLGRLKQRMYRAHIATEVALPGMPIFAPNMPGQSAGTVVDAQSSPEGGSDLLAVIQIASIQAGELHLGSEAGERLEIRSLPYPLDPRE